MPSSKKLKIFALGAGAFLISSTFFMNCAKDSLPDEVTNVRSQSAPLSAFYSPSPLPVSTSSVNSSANISVAGGQAPYSFTQEAGSGALTGPVYTAPMSPETASVRVTDARGEYVNVIINVIGSQPSLPSVMPGQMTFDTPGNFSFTLPAYNTLTVEVWGGGGGGQHCGILYGIPVCNFGGAGGDSSFDVLLARGGQGLSGGTAQGGDLNLSGEAGNWNGTNCSGLGGASGGPYGSATRQGVVPGGGGNGLCVAWGANGGGGGGYSMKQYSAPALPVGSSITGQVGAGGAAGGASGRVRISWN